MQSGHSLSEFTSSAEAAWKAIYDGALEEDEAKVRSALSNATLTILNNEGHSPVYQLAFEATSKSLTALHFLLGKFPLSRMALEKEMLRGFIASHHLYYAKTILQREEKPALKWILTKSFILHCAQFGYNQEVKNIFDAATPAERHYLLPLIAEVYAINHNNTALELLWENNPNEHFNLLMGMTGGICTRGGKITELETLWGSINFLERKHLLEQAVTYYSQCRHLDSARTLMIENDQHRFCLSSNIIRSLFLPHDFDFAKDLVDRSDSEWEKLQLYKAMVHAAIKSGHVAFAKWLLLPKTFKTVTKLDATEEIQSELLESLTGTYMHKWHIELAKKIIDEEQDPEKKLLLIKCGIRVCASVGNVEEVNQLLANALQIDSSAIDSELIKLIVSEYIIAGLESETAHLRSIVILHMTNQMVINDEDGRQMINQINQQPDGDRILALVNREDPANQNAMIDLENELKHQNLGTPESRQIAIELLEARMTCYSIFIADFEFYKLGGFETTGHIVKINNLVNQLAPGEDNLQNRFALFSRAARGLAFFGYVDLALQLKPTNDPKAEYYFDQGIATIHLHVGDFEKVLDYLHNADNPEQFLKDLMRFMVNGRFLKSNSALFLLSMFQPQKQDIMAQEAKTFGLNLETSLTLSKQLNADMQKYQFSINDQYKLKKSWALVNKFLLTAGPDIYRKLNAQFVSHLLTYLVPMSERQSWKFLEKYCENIPRASVIMKDEKKEEEKKVESSFKMR